MRTRVHFPTLEEGNVDQLLCHLREAQSAEVRKAAVYALGNNDLPAARAALLDIIETLGRDSL